MPSMAHASLGTDDAERRGARAMTNARGFRGMNEASGGRCVKVKICLGSCGCATQHTPDPCEGRYGRSRLARWAAAHAFPSWSASGIEAPRSFAWTYAALKTSPQPVGLSIGTGTAEALTTRSRVTAVDPCSA